MGNGRGGEGRGGEGRGGEGREGRAGLQDNKFLPPLECSPHHDDCFSDNHALKHPSLHGN